MLTSLYLIQTQLKISKIALYIDIPGANDIVTIIIFDCVGCRILQNVFYSEAMIILSNHIKRLCLYYKSKLEQAKEAFITMQILVGQSEMVVVSILSLQKLQYLVYKYKMIDRCWKVNMAEVARVGRLLKIIYYIAKIKNLYKKQV